MNISFFEKYFKLKNILIYISMKKMKKKLKIVEADISCWTYMSRNFFHLILLHIYSAFLQQIYEILRYLFALNHMLNYSSKFILSSGKYNNHTIKLNYALNYLNYKIPVFYWDLPRNKKFQKKKLFWIVWKKWTIFRKWRA